MKSKVLMLGWEFPPILSGGLSVATYGLVKALAAQIDITLLLPYKHPESAVEGVHIIGTNDFKSTPVPAVNIKNREIDFVSTLAHTHGWQEASAWVSGYPTTATSTVAAFAWEADNRFWEMGLYSEEEVQMKCAMLFGNGGVLAHGDPYGPDTWKKMTYFTLATDCMAREIDFEIIHAHDWLTFPAAVRLQKNTGKPLVLHVHSLETDRVGPAVRNAVYNIEYEAMHKATRIVAVSRYTAKCIEEYYQVPAEKIVFVHNGIEQRQVTRWRHVIPQRIVSFIGRLTTQKGPQYLLETARLVIERYPNVIFVVAGKGDMLDHLIHEVADQRLSKYFFFSGFLDRADVDALLATSDVYFMPSVSEPFGLSALEAVQAGAPGVLSKQSGVSEVLDELPVADFWDTQLFAEQILLLLEDEAFAKEISESSQNRLEHITWSAAASRVKQLYHTLLSALQ